jgi:hypothetical protein
MLFTLQYYDDENNKKILHSNKEILTFIDRKLKKPLLSNKV